MARKWGYDVKGVPDGQATIVVADGNFHGRTTTIVGFSTDPDARDGFGPFTPGFRIVPYGDADALAAAIDETTVAVLIEPIQGEAGVHRAAAGLPRRRCARICDERNVLLIADEIQSGLGRTGDDLRRASTRASCRTCYCSARRSAAASCRSPRSSADRDVLGVLRPGQHGSHLRRQPAGVRRRPGRGRAARDRRVPAPRRASWASGCTAG